MQIIYHGHSFVEIEIEQGSILIDPFITGNPKCDISLEEVFKKNIIAICITHGHADHIGDVLEIKSHFSDVSVYTVTWVAKYLTDQWCTHCIWWSIGWTLAHDLFSVKLVVAHHDGNILDTGISTTPSGMIFTLWDKTIYHMWDTALTKDFELVKEYGPKIDCLLVPIGGHYTMDVSDAVVATGMIHPKIVVPIHYNTRSTIKADDLHFAQQIMLKQYGVPKVLRAGQYVVL